VAGDPNRPVLASLLAGRYCGEGVLPASLGLPEAELNNLWDAYFPGPRLPLPDQKMEDVPERQDLVALLLEYRAGRFPSDIWLAFISWPWPAVAATTCGRTWAWPTGASSPICSSMPSLLWPG